MSPDDLRALPHERASRLAPILYALWQDGQGDWAAAHHIAQELDNAQGAWLHAYLHRREGDLANAAYWYRRAGKPIAAGPPAEEWASLATALL